MLAVAVGVEPSEMPPKPAEITATSKLRPITGKTTASGDDGRDPYLPFLLSSREQTREPVSAERSLLQFREAPEGRLAERIVALLVLDLGMRNVLGVELNDDRVRQDVKRVTVGFTGRRLVDPSESVEATRRKLRCRTVRPGGRPASPPRRGAGSIP